MPSSERTARTDQLIARIADELDLPADELVSDWVLCLRTVPPGGPSRDRVVTSSGDVDASCRLLCRIQRFLVHAHSRLRH